MATSKIQASKQQSTNHWLPFLIIPLFPQCPLNCPAGPKGPQGLQGVKVSSLHQGTRIIIFCIDDYVTSLTDRSSLQGHKGRSGILGDPGSIGKSVSCTNLCTQTPARARVAHSPTIQERQRRGLALMKPPPRGT